MKTAGLKMCQKLALISLVASRWGGVSGSPRRRVGQPVWPVLAQHRPGRRKKRLALELGRKTREEHTISNRRF